MAKKLAKLLALGLMVIMALGLAACGQEKEITFEIGSAGVPSSYWGHDSEQPIKVIVRSLEEWNNSEAAELITIDEKYDAEFFTDNALVIVAFRTTSGPCEVEKITASKSGNRLNLVINATAGVQTVISGAVVAIEVRKHDIVGVKNIELTTNIGY